MADEKALTTPALLNDDNVKVKSSFNSQSYMHKTMTKRWSNDEKSKLLTALSVFGTDFNAIELCFFKEGRTRTQIYNQFKRMEKEKDLNMDKVLNEKLSLEEFEKVYGKVEIIGGKKEE